MKDPDSCMLSTAKKHTKGQFLGLGFLEEQELNGVMAKNKDRSRVKVKKRGVENKIRTRTRLTFPNTTACKGLLGGLVVLVSTRVRFFRSQ